MLIGLAFIGAAVLGVAVDFLVPGRSLRGRAVAGFVSAASAGVIYTALTWLGIGEGNVWLWVASILGAALVSLAVTGVITAVRRRRDAAEQQRLGIA